MLLSSVGETLVVTALPLPSDMYVFILLCVCFFKMVFQSAEEKKQIDFGELILIYGNNYCIT